MERVIFWLNLQHGVHYPVFDVNFSISIFEQLNIYSGIEQRTFAVWILYGANSCLFSKIGQQITKVTEMSLSANQERKKMEKTRLKWKVEGHPDKARVVRGGAVDPVKLVVELAPMEIRTFIINLDYLKIFGS